MARFLSLVLHVALAFSISAKEAAAAITAFGYVSSVSLATAGSLAGGCASAGFAGYLYIDANASLTANTSLRCNLVVAGGIISLNGFQLTVNGAISGDPDTQIIKAGTTSSTTQLVTITGGTVLYGAWFTGPYGNSAIDYSPGLQQAYNFVCRINGSPTMSTPGPRVLDVQSTGDRNFSPGIFLNSTIVMPDNAYGCTTLDAGTAWEMVPHSKPFFKFNATVITNTGNGTTEWSFLGSPATSFFWKNSTVGETQDVVFDMECTTGGDGHNNIKIDGAIVTGYSFISTEGTSSDCLNGWWASDIRNIYGAFMTGPTISHRPSSNASERQNYFNITNINADAAAVGPVFDIADVGGLAIDQWSIDGYGQTGNFFTGPLINLSVDTNFDIRGGHMEQNYTSLAAGVGFIQIGQTGASSQGSVDHLQVYRWRPKAVGCRILSLRSMAPRRYS